MPTKKLNPVCQKQVKKALESYRKEVHEAPLADNTKKTYLLHAENFVRWLDGNFEPGGRNKLGFLVLAIAVSIAVFSPSFSAIAGNKEDAARIERKFEIRKLAREIYKKADKRATEAAKQSPTYQENNKKTVKAIQKCHVQANVLIKALESPSLTSLRFRELSSKVEEILNGPDGCTFKAIKRNPNAQIIRELRDEFIDEELERLRGTLENMKRKELESEIRKLSI